MHRHWHLGWSGLTFTTTAANSAVLRAGRRCGRPLRAWFDIGAWVGLGLSAAATTFLVFSLCAKTVELFDVAVTRVLAPTIDGPAAAAELEPGGRASSTTSGARAPTAAGSSFDVVPLLPGITVPLGHVGYIWCAAVLSLLVHELGHALAATSQDVRVDAVGVHLLPLPPVPAAFVQIAPYDEQATLARGRLRIYYAGVWHNLVLCAAVLALWFFGSRAFDWFATAGDGSMSSEGLLVVAVAPRAAIAGSIRRGDAMTAINGVALAEVVSFTVHLDTIAADPSAQPGFCVPDGTFGGSGGGDDSSAAVASCCALGSADTSRQCFHDGRAGVSPAVFANATDPAAVAGPGYDGPVAAAPFHCASMADLHGLRLPMCQQPGKAPPLKQQQQQQPQQPQQQHQQPGRSPPPAKAWLVEHACPLRHRCYFPVLAEGDVMARLTTRGLQHVATQPAKHTLFVGPPQQLAASMRLSARAPAVWLRRVLAVVPRWLAEWMSVDLPHSVGPRLCLYIVSVSAGVAFLNALPIWAFDGAHVLGVLFVALPALACCRPEAKSILDGGVGSSCTTNCEAGRSNPVRAGRRSSSVGARTQRWILHAGTAVVAANTVLSVAVAALR